MRRPLTYQVRSAPEGGRARLHAVCAQCGREGTVPLGGTTHSPDATAKLFRREGWEFDPHTPRKCVCPSCVAERIKARKGAPMSAKPAPKALPPEKTSLSPTEKAAVRLLLDKHFDDAAGKYLDGYSDQRIGRECKVPWSLVTHMREAAYGEIRVDETAESLRADVAKLRADISQLRDKIAEMDEANESGWAGAQKALDALAEKVDRYAQDRR